VIRRRDAYDRDRAGFVAARTGDEAALRDRILAARDRLAGMQTPDAVLRDCAELCVALGSDGLRGELTLLRAGRALAAFDGADVVTRAHLRRIAPMALSHRLRRDPLDEAGSGARVARTVAEVFTA